MKAAPMPILPYFAISSQICCQIREDCFPRQMNGYILVGRQQEKRSFTQFLFYTYFYIFSIFSKVIEGDWSEGLKGSRASKGEDKGQRAKRLVFSILFLVFLSFNHVYSYISLGCQRTHERLDFLSRGLGFKHELVLKSTLVGYFSL